MIPSLSGGILPIGRFPATLDMIETAFVQSFDWATSTTRPSIWSDLSDVLSGVRARFPICALWIGGSFLTGKMDPDDVDVTFILDSRVLAGLTSSSDRNLAALLSRGKELRVLTGARLDTYVIQWVPDPDGLGQTPGFADYAASRGYWDDLWQRKIAGAKHDPRVPADALPRRGYLEVTLDGFDE